MTRKHTTMTVSALAAAALALSACSPAAEDELQEATTPAAASVTTATASPETETETETETKVLAPAAASAGGESTAGGQDYSIEERRVPQASGTKLTIADVRAGTHDGYDRVVFEFTGTGSPGFLTRYTAEPLQQASGLPMEVAGNAYLEVMIQGTPMGSMPAREDLIQAGPMDVGAGNVKGVTHGGVFEADTQYVIGLDKQRPYNVYALDNPVRLVVDIQQ